MSKRQICLKKYLQKSLKEFDKKLAFYIFESEGTIQN